MATTSARLGLDEPTSTENISGFPVEDAQALGILDNAALYFSGTLSARGSVTPLVPGLIYKATDTGDLSIYDGSAWNNLVKAQQSPADMTFGSGSMTFTTGGGSTVVTHNLGRTPTCVIVTDAGNTSGYGFAYSVNSQGATQFTAVGACTSSYSGTKGFFWQAIG